MADTTEKRVYGILALSVLGVVLALIAVACCLCPALAEGRLIDSP